jgi:hypothetical protein
MILAATVQNVQLRGNATQPRRNQRHDQEWVEIAGVKKAEAAGLRAT